MHRALPLLALAASLHAAVIRGTVAENSTGNALAGALVALQPIGTSAAAPAATRANDSGNFEFAQVPAGAYIVKASRRGFLSLEYGQRQWNSAGTPVNLTDDSVVFLNIRLHRPGAVTGVVRDENDVGMAGHEVIAYRYTQPPQLTTRAKSDDRGVYRLSGLEPGTYLVRTTGSAGADASYIPTFSKQTLRVEDAQQVRVYLDEDAKGVDVHPEQGRLFTLEGSVSPADGYSLTVTLASDIGRRVVNAPVFSFSGLPQGAYEIYAEGRSPGDRLPPKGAWVQINLTRDLKDFVIPMQDLRETQFDFTPRQAGRSSSVSVIARRKDLAGAGDAQLLKIASGRATIAPGRWEMIAIPPEGSYVSQFSPASRDKPRPDGWNEVAIQSYTFVRIAISGSASALHGVVRAAGETVEGAPVFLEAWDPETRRRLIELRTTRTDPPGSYTFTGLAPGTYRLMSSFEYLAPDSAAIDLALPHTLKIEPHADLALDLDLFGLR
ncbi:MAG: carboxypeptidase-like regulatory domain-containing protein [Acidobacteriota bacterium]|nr:carboxypeptidase-like regulatory domain-containing protein [Acidobacteriota bacterium]